MDESGKEFSAKTGFLDIYESMDCGRLPDSLAFA
jgi:hypothetical protein